MDVRRVKVGIGGVTVFENGRVKRVRQSAPERAVRGKDVIISVELGGGRTSATVWTCDLSREYVSINSEYHT